MVDMQKVVGGMALFLAVAGLAGGAVVVHDQRGQIAGLQAEIAGLTAKDAQQALDAEVSSKALAGAQGQIAKLSSSLTAAQGRIGAAEKKLDLTVAQLPPDVSKLARAVVPSVVFLSCGSGTGTGFALSLPKDAQGRTAIVTAAHVVSDCSASAEGGGPSPVSVTTADRSVEGDVAQIDENADVAVVYVALPLKPLRAAATDPAQGEFVVAIGNPLGAAALAGSVTQGTVSKVLGDQVTHTAPISSGNSGGPLVNRNGEVVGVVTAVITSSPEYGVHTENLNIAVRLRALCNASLAGPSCAALH